jgi:cbb3-type cytochrome oxidase maturation protein
MAGAGHRCARRFQAKDCVVESLYLLIPFSILLIFIIGGLFWWATRSGQFDDLEGPGHRILMDDDKPAPPSDPARQRPPR